MSHLPPVSAPRSKLFLTYSNFNSPKSCHGNFVLQHPFNHQVEVFVPGQIPSRSELVKGVLDTEYFYKARLRLSYFIQPEFLRSHVRNGSVTALTHNTGIDTDDVFALDSTGHLILSVTKDTYEELGLIGKPSKFASKGHRYTVTIDLNADNMIPGHKIYERVKWCFEHTLTDTFTFLIQSTNPAGECVELEFPLDAEARKIFPKYLESSNESIEIPSMESLLDNENVEIWKEEAMERYEWLGMVACQSTRVQANSAVDPFVSIYSTPTPFEVGTGSSFKLTGLISSYSINTLINNTREYIRDKKLPWVSFSVWGFMDSPTSWQFKEHGYLPNGENHYTFIMYPNGTYILYQTCGAHDGSS
ncbi:hypothetical protein K7432_001288 [Basidiobolus ranarum]|uniref:Uncharacterized protein n=1 Tax=Basidiobolus ranarum TaxID=34480 RepID=A0ABR2W9W4_9FUNG